MNKLNQQGKWEEVPRELAASCQRGYGMQAGWETRGSKKKPCQITVWRRPREKGWGGAIDGCEGGQLVLPEAGLNGVVNTQCNMQRMNCRLPQLKTSLISLTRVSPPSKCN